MVAVARGAEQRAAMAGMFEDVGRELGRHSERRRTPADRSNPGAVVEIEHLARADYFHRTTVTLVPRPGVVSISNSLTSRREPPRPSPSPLPVVNPSRNACSTSGIP